MTKHSRHGAVTNADRFGETIVPVSRSLVLKQNLDRPAADHGEDAPRGPQTTSAMRSASRNEHYSVERRAGIGLVSQVTSPLVADIIFSALLCVLAAGALAIETLWSSSAGQ